MGCANSPSTGEEIDLRLDWGEVKKVFDNAGNSEVAAASARVGKVSVHRDFPLSNLDPTQEACANRVLKCVRELLTAYRVSCTTVVAFLALRLCGKWEIIYS